MAGSRIVFAVLLAAVSLPRAAQQQATIDVVGLTPVDGVGLDVDRYPANVQVAVELAVTNFTNTRYETFGAFGDPAEILGDRYDDPRFVSPGQPRAWRVSVRFRG